MSQEPLQSPEPTSTSAHPQATAPASDSDNRSHHSKQQSLLRMLGQLGGIVLALMPVLLDLLRQLWQLVLPTFRWLGQQWVALLPKIRTVLPASLSKLPDSGLTAIAIGLLLMLFWLPGAFSANRSPAIAEAPVGTEATDQPQAPQPKVSPRPNSNTKRITAIQKQLLEVTIPYAEDLVETVQADFIRNRLLVNVTEHWDTLATSRREQLANELLKQSKKLKFEHLDITDAEGNLLARSPVVGSQMVLLTGMPPA